MTERDIQIGLYLHLVHRKGIPNIWPNTDKLTGYEADLLAVTKAGYAYEYEIKRTKSDFRADKKKLQKHASLAGTGMTKLATPGGKERYVLTAQHLKQPRRIYLDACYPNLRPKYFWYVCWSFEPPADEVPDYAGVMLVDRRGKGPWISMDIIKPAPILPSQKVDPARIARANRSMAYRYWNLLQTIHKGTN
jgi:hypothetical protein